VREKEEVGSEGQAVREKQWPAVRGRSSAGEAMREKRWSEGSSEGEGEAVREKQ
jgi:hypothetical protein